MFSFMEVSMPLRSITVAGLILLILFKTFVIPFRFLTAGTEDAWVVCPGVFGGSLLAAFAFIFFTSAGAAFFAVLGIAFVFKGIGFFFAMFFAIIFPNSSMPSPSKPFKYCKSIG